MSDRCVSYTSLAHTVGNVTAKYTKTLSEMFGKNYFKYVHINTRMAYREYVINMKEFIKKNNPKLIIKPRIDIMNEDIFLTHSLLTTNKYNQFFLGHQGSGFNFMPLFNDLDKGNKITYLMNRIRVIFDVIIKVDTVIEQMNLFNYLKNSFCENQPYYNKTAIEILIPGSIIDILSFESGIPIYDKNGEVKEFLSYLNKNFKVPVTYKAKCSNNREEFFLFYPLTIENFYTDFSMGDVEKKGMVDGSCDISFTLTTEFNTIGIFEYIAGDEDLLKKYSFDFEVDFNRQNVIIPMFTYDKLFTGYNDRGWKLLTARMFKVDDDVVEDRVDLKGYFENSSLKDLIDYHNKHGLPCELIMDIQLMKDGDFLKLGTEYTFDWETLELVVLKVNSRSTYRLIIYTNNEYINSIVAQESGLELKD